MNRLEKIYGILFTGGMAIAFFYLAYLCWADNLIFSLFLGFFGLIFAFYSIGLFLLPFIDSFKKKKK